MERHNGYPWRLFVFLLSLSLIGFGAVLPYLLEISANALRSVPLPLPIPILVALQFAQSLTMSALAVGIGLLVSRKLGLGAPLLEAWLYHREYSVPARSFALAAVAGVAIALVIFGIAQFLFHGIINPLLEQETAIPLWKRFLASFYGALNEEILIRLFLLSVVLWLVGKFWRNSQGQPSKGAFWTANFVAAILFGLGHIPAATLVMRIDATTILYLLLLNGIAGLLFGYLFWKNGLEWAMIAHWFADIVLLMAATLLR